MGDLNCASFVPPTYDLAISDSENFTFNPGLTSMAKHQLLVQIVVALGCYWSILVGNDQ